MELCVYPHKMTIDCNDCYKCRVDYFNWVRQDMINKYGLTDQKFYDIIYIMKGGILYNNIYERINLYEKNYLLY